MQRIFKFTCQRARFMKSLASSPPDFCIQKEMEILKELQSLISQTLVIQREVESNTLDFIRDFKTSIRKGKEILDLLEQSVIKAVNERNERLSTVLEDCILAPLKSLVDDSPLLPKKEIGEEKEILSLSPEQEQKEKEKEGETPRLDLEETKEFWIVSSQDLIDWCCFHSQRLKFWHQFTTLEWTPLILQTEILDSFDKNGLQELLGNQILFQNFPIILTFPRIQRISSQLPQLRKLSLEFQLHWNEKIKEFYCLSNVEAIPEFSPILNYQKWCFSPREARSSQKTKKKKIWIPLPKSTLWKMEFCGSKLWLTLSSEMERKGTRFFAFPLPSKKLLTVQLQKREMKFEREGKGEFTTKASRFEEVGKKGCFLYYITNKQVFVHNLDTGKNRIPFKFSLQDRVSSIEIDHQGNLQGIFITRLSNLNEVVRIGKWVYNNSENKW